MSLVISIQAYYTTSDAWNGVTACPQPGHVTLLDWVTVDCDDPYQPVLPMALAEHHIKKLLADGYLTEQMRVSACVWLEQADENMNDVSEIVTWFDTSVSNMHHADSNWW